MSVGFVLWSLALVLLFESFIFPFFPIKFLIIIRFLPACFEWSKSFFSGSHEKNVIEVDFHWTLYWLVPWEIRAAMIPAGSNVGNVCLDGVVFCRNVEREWNGINKWVWFGNILNNNWI